ncbi:hypothetical protein D5F51_22330 (plasmid) [Yersinia hibernica]|uniref:Invasin domain-containing protein n=2 Tax=Yersinia hibernica TaxID=2339259 RepID=A0ABX5R6Z9_9GAMM|nr:hypothetical protein D5F51_22330 [Yersinia hibernica]
MRDNTLGWVSHPLTRIALIAAVTMGASTPAWSVVLSNPTGQIKGRTPTAAGSVSILKPGATPLVDNDQVLGSEKPNEFTLAPLSPGVTFTDLDGDTQAVPGLAIAPAGVTWTWKNGLTPLTPTQLTQTFATNFAHNTTLTVQANAPVLSTSLTGLPTTSGTPIPLASPVYRVRVNNPPPPVIYVNGTTFAWNSGFPTMGFVGAKFQLYMNGVDATANSNYTYKENGNQTWVDIPASNASGTEGTFTFTGTPTSANKTLKLIATNKTDSSDEHTLNITLGRWFVNGGATTRTAANADAYCTGLGGGYSTPPYATMTNAAYGAVGTRAPSAGLWSQWGAMGTFGSGWLSNYYWALEPGGAGRLHVDLDNGGLYSVNPSGNYYVACSRVL